MTVYDANGDVVAFNNDSFQDTDSTIIDLTLPTTGIYYVEVTSEPEPAGQTGAYELFMYTFATDGGPARRRIRCMRARATTRSSPGAGDDTITAQLPLDTIIRGSGTLDMLANAPYLDVSAGANQTVNEGDTVTLTGSFIDPDDADTHTYDWHVVASSGQQIADGTGSCFTFSPGNAGLYTVTYTVSDTNGGSARPWWR